MVFYRMHTFQALNFEPVFHLAAFVSGENVVLIVLDLR